MTKKLLTAATILATCAVSPWSQATEPPAPAVASTPIEAPTDASVIQPQPLLAQLTEPPIEDDFSSLGGSSRARVNNAWVRAEFLMWAIKQGQSPPLVQSSDVPDGDMTTLFGGNLNHDLRLGGRFTAGTWLDSCQTHGIEGSYFFLDGPSDGFSGFSSGLDGGAWLSRPYIDLDGVLQNQNIFIPGVASGTIDISSLSLLQGAELNLLSNLCPSSTACDSCDSYGSCDSMCGPRSGHRWDLISGFRYMNLQEDLSINERLTFLPENGTAPIFEPGTTIALSDDFATRNNFYGGQIGLRRRWWHDRWFVDVTGKVALGTTHQQVRINGNTVIAIPGDIDSPYNEQGGLLALTNIGSYSRNRFSTIPEVGINVGRQMTDHLRVSVGYNFMYWSSVVRPGDQFDLVVDEAQLPFPGSDDPVREPFAFNSTDFWAQGISFGLEYAW